ncbi:MAG: uroporphyrinogen-III C-methyltransferase [Chitinophagales bacterium]
MNSILTLVGAGPGDPELITLKAINALKIADVILYDALVDESLLEYASQNCLKVFVGKRAGKACHKQEDINSAILKYGKMFQNVVRLKGGDPFIFGRGFEELELAKEAGMEVRFVPGISSSTSLAGLNNIPLTSRGVSDSFWVITGTKSNLDLSSDLLLAAQSNATVVVLMGLNKLKRIAQIFEAQGKQDMPVTVIQNGSTSEEKTAIGRISDIVKKVREKRIGTPAVIIIGPVVELYSNLEQKEKAAVLERFNSKKHD